MWPLTLRIYNLTVAAPTAASYNPPTVYLTLYGLPVGEGAGAKLGTAGAVFFCLSVVAAVLLELYARFNLYSLYWSFEIEKAAGRARFNLVACACPNRDRVQVVFGLLIYAVFFYFIFGRFLLALLLHRI